MKIKNMKKISIYTLAFGILIIPSIALGQFGVIDDFLGDVSAFINSTLIPLVFALALLMFIWGMFKFLILGGSEEESRKEGKNLMLWSVIGFVVMVSIFGIVNLLAGGLGFADDQTLQNIPIVPPINR